MFGIDVKYLCDFFMIEVERFFQDKNSALLGIQTLQQYEQRILQNPTAVCTCINAFFGDNRSRKPSTRVLLHFITKQIFLVDRAVYNRSNKVVIWIFDMFVGVQKMVVQYLLNNIFRGHEIAC